MKHGEILLMIMFVIGFLVGLLVMDYGSKAHWQKKSIEHKAAQYNAVTGDFEWIRQEDR